MAASIVNRSDLKQNFLKEIIMRLDFQGVLQAEMEKILLQVKPYLKEKSFNRYEEKVSNQIINNGMNVTDVSSQIVYSFMSETSGYTMEISNTSIVLTVSSQTYSPFSDYADIFCHLAKIYGDTIDFFTVKRFGLRKINFCFIKNREDINKYFVPDYYCCETPIKDYTSLATERIERFTDGSSNINLKHAIEEGKLDEEIFYKVTLDSDIYIAEQKNIENVIFDDKSMDEINDKLFRVYLNAITDEFLELLCSEDGMDSDKIVGVELNE